jgi:predicted AlkP superfamily pyrophosphatase or phosphodiesterase
MLSLPKWVAAIVAASFCAAAQTPARDRLVIIASIDGFSMQMLKDPNTSVPNVRRLMTEGVFASEGMRSVNPTVTWPNHTSIVTGVEPSRHGLLYNGLPVRTPGAAMRVQAAVPKENLVLAPTLYDLAHKAGLKTAEVDWVAIEDAPTIDYSFFEIPKAGTPVVREMVQAGLITDEQVRNFTKLSINVRDEFWTEAAIHILRKYRPNLLLFHMLTTDSVQHRYGTGALAAQTALAFADRQLGRLLDAVRDMGMQDRTTVFVVSDHGFHSATKIIRPNTVLKRDGLLRSAVDCDAWVIPEGGTAMVYITNEARRAELLPKLRQSLGALEGVDSVIGSEQYADLGYPPPGSESRMSDLVLAAKPGYAFGGEQDGASVVDVPAGSLSGNHGYLNTMPDMTAIFIAAGAGIKKGAPIKSISNLNVAPTAARLLSLEMKNVQGRVMTEILR